MGDPKKKSSIVSDKEIGGNSRGVSVKILNGKDGKVHERGRTCSWHAEPENRGQKFGWQIAFAYLSAHTKFRCKSSVSSAGDEYCGAKSGTTDG